MKTRTDVSNCYIERRKSDFVLNVHSNIKFRYLDAQSRVGWSPVAWHSSVHSVTGSLEFLPERSSTSVQILCLDLYSAARILAPGP